MSEQEETSRYSCWPGNQTSRSTHLCAENPTALPFEGIWDPLGCADFNFWGLGNEATIGYLRHAEIKHGRIAMAGFLGFFVQSPGNFIGDIVSGDHAILPYRGYVAGCTPQEQWANIPMIGKLQILTAVGMLESYGEGAGFPESYTHYTKGGQPGYYPPIKGRGPAWKSTSASGARQFFTKTRQTRPRPTPRPRLGASRTPGPRRGGGKRQQQQTVLRSPHPAPFSSRHHTPRTHATHPDLENFPFGRSAFPRTQI